MSARSLARCSLGIARGATVEVASRSGRGVMGAENCPHISMSSVNRAGLGPADDFFQGGDFPPRTLLPSAHWPYSRRQLCKPEA